MNSDDDVPPSDGDDIDEGMADDDAEIDNAPLEAETHADEAAAFVTHTEAVLSVAICPTNPQMIVTGGQDDVAVLWSLSEQDGSVTVTQRQRLEGHTDSVTQVSFSHDGQYVASGSYDGTVKIWTADGALLHTLEATKEIEWTLWHPKGHALLAGSSDTMVWMWWAPTGKLMQIFTSHAQRVTCGCWPNGGKLICTGSEDCSIVVWNPRAGTPQQHLRQLHESPVVCMCAHPESPIVVTGSEDKTAKVVQVETGSVIATLTGHDDSVEAVAFSNATGLLLLATASMDGRVQVWNAKKYDLRCTMRDHEGSGGVTTLKWLPPSHSELLCTSSTDRTLRLFNALSGQCVRTLYGHSDTVLSLDLSVVGGANLCVVSGSDDSTCRVFAVSLNGAAPDPEPSVTATG
uniref:Angio-associated migratory cell protein n=1 Tax=Noctiluca scintillans TaxID=2966 RepID=A0A7S1F7U0_NOCSC